VEERRDFLEEQIVQLLARRALHGKKSAIPVYGKVFPGGREGSLPRAFQFLHLVELLAPLITELASPKLKIDQAHIDRELALLAENLAIDVQLAHAHRLSALVSSSRFSQRPRRNQTLLYDADYMRKTHRREPVDPSSTATRAVTRC